MQIIGGWRCAMAELGRCFALASGTIRPGSDPQAACFGAFGAAEMFCSGSTGGATAGTRPLAALYCSSKSLFSQPLRFSLCAA